MNSQREVDTAYAKYVALRNALVVVKPGPFPYFPSGGDPKIELFNLMSRAHKERTEMIEQAEQDGEGRAVLKAAEQRKKSKRRSLRVVCDGQNS